MATRLQLHDLLKEILGSDNVYFQLPTSIEMQYPCIIYKREDSQTEHADNQTYTRIKRYQVTVIDRNPDSELPDKVEELPLCAIDRVFTAENLNHYVFTLFF